MVADIVVSVDIAKSAAAVILSMLVSIQSTLNYVR